MKNIINEQKKQIEQLFGLYLKQYNSSPTGSSAKHLDGDILNAFIESCLTKRTEPLVITHLVECPLCRHSVSRLLELAEHCIEKPETAAVVPTKVETSSQVLERLTERIFGLQDDAVYSYEDNNDSKNCTNEDGKDGKT